MDPWVRALNLAVDNIKQLSERRGTAVTEKDIAEKMGMAEAKFRDYLSGKYKVPAKLKAIWLAYEYLLKDKIAADRLNGLKVRMDWLQRQAEKDKVTITNEEIARRVDVSPETLQGWLDGSIEIPEDLSLVFYNAFKQDLFRNVEHIFVTNRTRARSVGRPPKSGE